MPAPDEPPEAAGLLVEEQEGPADHAAAQNTSSVEFKSSVGPASLLSTWQSLKTPDKGAASLQSAAPTVVTGPTLVTGPTIVTGIKQDRPLSIRQTVDELLPGHESLIPYPELPSIPSSVPATSHMQLADMRETVFASVPSSSITAPPQVPSPTGVAQDQSTDNCKPPFASIPVAPPATLNDSPLRHGSPKSFTRIGDQSGMSSHCVPASVSPPSRRIYGSLIAAALRDSTASLDAASPTGRATVTAFPGRSSFSRMSRDEAWQGCVADDSQPLLVDSPRISHAGAPWMHYQVPPVSQADQSGAAAGYRQGSYANDITLGVINFVIVRPDPIVLFQILMLEVRGVNDRYAFLSLIHI